MNKIFTKTKSAFTLIELLVVIAIIGILSGIVIVNLNSARAKGLDAAIGYQLSSIRTAASSYYDINTYKYSTNPAGSSSCGATANTLFADPGIAASIAKLQKDSASVKCAVDASGAGWAILAQLKSDTSKYVCADDSGTFKETTIANIAGSVASSSVSCP